MKRQRARAGALLVCATIASLLLTLTLHPASADSSSASSTSTATGKSSQPRQSAVSNAAAVLGALGQLVPSLITNVAPLVLLFGIGALMMPALGLNTMGLMRESRRSSNEQPLAGLNPALQANYAHYARPLQTSPQDIYYFTKRSLPSLMSGFNTAGVVRGLQDVLERVARAIDNADKRYN